ncbi:MAG TPA: IS4 family transposase [Acidocella sp.]|nr:IS4 family transposase [Acidocella sp.]
MTPHELPVVLNLYAQIAPGEMFRLLQRMLGCNRRDGIFTPRAVLWMMMLERLDPRGSLASSVEQLVQGKMDVVLSRCKRVRERKISLATGGYCQARQNLPRTLMQRSVEELIQRLRNHLGERVPAVERAVYVVDGTGLQLDHSPALADAYPGAQNQHGKSHWPIVRMLVLHDVETGIAEQPQWGPMYGPKAVSEQALAQQAMASLPGQSVIIGDRNFGIYGIACGAQQNGHDAVIRLTKQRAWRLHGGPISQVGEEEVVWRASRWDQVEGLPAGAEIAGRLIAWRVGRGRKKQWLYLFTTLAIPAEQVVELYGLRWNIETDLRNLKQTVRLHHLNVQSADLMEKELLAAVLAYNLVRAMMCLAARQTGVRPRQLSFTYASNFVRHGILTVLEGRTDAEQVCRMERLIDLVGRCRLRRRAKRRAFPHKVWGRGFRYPQRSTHEN